MDMESELNLYDHVEFLDQPASAVSGARTESKQSAVGVTNRAGNPSTKRKKNKNNGKKNQAQVLQSISKPAKSKKCQQLAYKLNACELLFFPKHHDVPPSYAKSDPDDLLRKKNYIEKIGKMSAKEQRIFRAKRDERYLHKNADNSNTTTADESNEKEFCLNHLVDRCDESNECERWHQMRKPRFFGVCKFYISGVCSNGDQCLFMHEDFPCRYYYLNIEHPKSVDVNNCRFMHGGPLPQRLSQYFVKQIEMNVRNMTKEKPEQFDSTLSEYMEKFESKQAELERESAGKINESFTSSSSNDDRFTIESVLSSKQMKALAEKNIKTFAQINQLPIDDLLELGLSMDQIYKITTNTCMETKAQAMEDPLVEGECSKQISSSHITMLDDSSTFACFETTEADFHGFPDVNVREAEAILRVKRRLFRVDNQMAMECVTTQFDSVDEVTMDSVAKEELSHFKAISPDENEAIQQQNIEDSDDSDSENCLFINEEDLA